MSNAPALRTRFRRTRPAESTNSSRTAGRPYPEERRPAGGLRQDDLAGRTHSSGQAPASSCSQAAHAAAWFDGQRTHGCVAPRVISTRISSASCGSVSFGAAAVAGALHGLDRCAAAQRSTSWSQHAVPDPALGAQPWPGLQGSGPGGAPSARRLAAALRLRPGATADLRREPPPHRYLPPRGHWQWVGRTAGRGKSSTGLAAQLQACCCDLRTPRGS